MNIDIELSMPDLEWQCYKNNFFGTLCYHLIALTAFVIMGIYWVILIDKYWMCQVSLLSS
jgi:hypothetical protein